MMEGMEGMEDEESLAGGDPIKAVERSIELLASTSDPASVFGDPVQHGDTLVIPCAEAYMGMGMGVGGGGGEDDEGESGEGTGGGGGGAARGRPVAAIIISSQGVRVEPIVDITRIALAGFTTLAFVVYWLGRLGRATRSDKQDKDPSFQQVRQAIQD
jgi:uncharacterized spore protein YtfJ